MRRLAKNLILATAVVSAIFLVDLSSAGAASFDYETAETMKSRATKKICPLETDSIERQYLDFWGKFRDTVMPDKPQNNNPPKEMRRPPPNNRHPQQQPPRKRQK